MRQGEWTGMKITMQDVEKVASLSMIHFSEEEKLQLQQDLSNIIAHVEKLNELDTEGVEPTTYILNQQNILREDIPQENMDRDTLMANAPQKDEGCFIVPKVVE